MKIGIIVDGKAEFKSLSGITKKTNTAASILKPLYADIQPHASVKRIVSAAMSSIKILKNRKVDEIVVLLDNENRNECLCSWRSDLEDQFEEIIRDLLPLKVHVVIKVQKFENWLISDPEVFSRLAEFTITKSMHGKICPDKADNADALSVLKSAKKLVPYSKVRDAEAIIGKLDLYRGAKNSRSLRRFLRVLRCSTYSSQSKKPA